MIADETSRLSAPGYALYSKAAGERRKTGEESTLKNTVSCVDNPDHIKETSEKIDIGELNKEISATVCKIDALRGSIDTIVAEIEGGNNE